MRTISFFLVLAMTLTVRAQTPTVADIQQSMHDGKYTPALKQIAQALAVRDAGNKYDLLMLKGECLLNVKSPSYAAQSFRAAMKEAPDVPKANVALATAILSERSPKLVYASRAQSKSEPIDILQPDNRKRAIGALYDDTRQSLEPRIKSAMNSSQLTLMIKLIPDMINMYALEYAAKDSAHESEATLQSMGARARELMGPELKSLSARVSQIQYAATDMVWVNGIMTQAGLTPPQRQDLNDIGKYVQQIEATARDARTMAHRLGAPGEHWEDIIADSAELLNAIDTLLQR